MTKRQSYAQLAIKRVEHRVACAECGKISRRRLKWMSDTYGICMYCKARLAIMWDSDGIGCYVLDTDKNPHQLHNERVTHAGRE
jgi:hypothetical protein